MVGKISCNVECLCENQFERLQATLWQYKETETSGQYKETETSGTLVWISAEEIQLHQIKAALGIGYSYQHICNNFSWKIINSNREATPFINVNVYGLERSMMLKDMHKLYQRNIRQG